jgi:hypothetical protein
MTVNVAEEENVSRLQSFLHHDFGVVDSWVKLRAWSLPLSIKVYSSERAPVVSNNDSIRVKHRHYFEYKG